MAPQRILAVARNSQERKGARFMSFLQQNKAREHTGKKGWSLRKAIYSEGVR